MHFHHVTFISQVIALVIMWHPGRKYWNCVVHLAPFALTFFLPNGKKKLYSTDEARAIILAPNAQDNEEDIDASDYGENSDFEDENSSERDSFMPMNVDRDTL